MFYMRKIAEKYNGEPYTGRKTSNKYLKDWYIGLTEEEEPQTHKYNLWYLRKMAKFLNPLIDDDLNENQCLRVISEYIEAITTVRLQVSQSSIIIDSSVTLTATVLDEHRTPVEDAEVTFYDGINEIDSDTTDSNGVASITYTPTVTGSHTLTATYDEYTSSEVSLSVAKHTSAFNGIVIAPPNLKVGDSYTVLGYLLIDDVGATGKSINIYDGDTVVGTATTSTNGAFRYDSPSTTTTGTLQIKAVFETDSKHTGCQTNTGTIMVEKSTPSLTINTPVITYMDEFEVTGTLKKGSIAIPNATIKLSWTVGGETQIATDTTNSQGVVKFSRTAPTTITTYSFQLIYDGNNMYNATNSQTINVEVGKETSVLTLTSPVNGAVMYDTGSMTVSGTLMDNDTPDPNPIANQTVYARLGVIQLGSYTTDNNGRISGVLKADNLDIGHNYIDFVFDGTNEYVGSSQTNIDVRVVESESLSLTATPDVLSYADSTVENPQIATFTAVHSGGSGKTVQLCDASDDSVIATMTDTGNGIYTYEYQSQGSGDIEYYAKDGSLVSERYSIRDVHYYADYSKIKSTWTKDTSVSGRTIYNYLNAVGNTTVEFKLKNSVPTSYLMGIGKFYNGGQLKSTIFNNNGTTKQWYSVEGGGENLQRSISASITSNTVFKFTISNTNTISFYVDDVLIGTDNCRNNFSNYLRIDDFTSTPLDLDYVIVV